MNGRALATALLLAACSGDASAPPETWTPVGTYDLETVNGSVLPVRVFESGPNWTELLADRFELRSGGAVHHWTHRRHSGGAQDTLTADGTWQETTTGRVFIDTGWLRASATVDRQGMEVQVSGRTHLYRRR
jgi:hypothetical protein